MQTKQESENKGVKKRERLRHREIREGKRVRKNKQTALVLYGQTSENKTTQVLLYHVRVLSHEKASNAFIFIS